MATGQVLLKELSFKKNEFPYQVISINNKDSFVVLSRHSSGCFLESNYGRFGPYGSISEIGTEKLLIATKKNKTHVFLNGKKIGEYVFFEQWRNVFNINPQFTNAIINSKVNGKYYLEDCIKKKKYGPFDTIQKLVWSDDGKSFAFLAKNNSIVSLYKDGFIMKSSNFIKEYCFTSDNYLFYLIQAPNSDSTTFKDYIFRDTEYLDSFNPFIPYEVDPFYYTIGNSNFGIRNIYDLLYKNRKGFIERIFEIKFGQEGNISALITYAGWSDKVQNSTESGWTKARVYYSDTFQEIPMLFENLTVSADGESIAYQLRLDSKRVMVYLGKDSIGPLKDFENGFLQQVEIVTNPYLTSNDLLKYGIIIKNGDSTYEVYIGGKHFGPYMYWSPKANRDNDFWAGIYNVLKFSPNGGNYAILSREGDSALIYTKNKRYNVLGNYHDFGFSKDGNYLIYTYYDEKAKKKYFGINNRLIDCSGKRKWGDDFYENDSAFFFVNIKESRKRCIWLNEDSIGCFDEILSIHRSPHGKPYFKAILNKKEYLYFNGKLFGPTDVISELDNINFSPDGNNIALDGMKNGKHYIYTNDTTYGPFDGIRRWDEGSRYYKRYKDYYYNQTYHFSDDSKELLFIEYKVVEADQHTEILMHKGDNLYEIKHYRISNWEWTSDGLYCVTFSNDSMFINVNGTSEFILDKNIDNTLFFRMDKQRKIISIHLLDMSEVYDIGYIIMDGKLYYGDFICWDTNDKALLYVKDKKLMYLKL